MGASTADISRNIFDEAKRYRGLVLHRGSGSGVPWVDADENDGRDIFEHLIRRLTQIALGDGAKGDAFLVAERDDGGLVANDLLISGASTTRAHAERLYVGGHSAVAAADMPWSSDPSICPKITGLTATVLMDSAANWTVDEFAGRTLVPDVSTPGNSYTILSNTVNTITIASGDMLADGAEVSDRYRVALSTPSGSDRSDIVWIDCWLDEIDCLEDTNLKHTLSSQVSGQYRTQLQQTVWVTEGVSSMSPGEFTDADGRLHVTLPLARLDRLDGVATIGDAQITDLRPKIFSLAGIDDRFVNESGDTMHGDLHFDDATRIVADGDPVLGTDEIDDGAITQAKLDRDTHLMGDGNVQGSVGQIVHDDRYLPKSLLATLFGPSLIVNGKFEGGLEGWTHNAPAPLVAAPGGDALDHVQVGWRMCSPSGCNGLYTLFRPGYKGCEVGLASQRIRLCGGGLISWSQVTRVVRGSVGVKPTLRLGLFSSEQFLGHVDVPLLEKADDGGTIITRQIVLTTEYGARQLRALVSLPSAVDSVVATLMLEPVVEDCELDELLEVITADVRAWQFADEGTIVDGVYVPPTPPGLTIPPGDPEPIAEEAVFSVGGRTAASALLLGDGRDTPVVTEVDGAGTVTFRPASRQETLVVHHTASLEGAFAWNALAGLSATPSVAETVAVRVPDIVDAQVAVSPTAAPPRIHQVTSITWEIGSTPHIAIAGRDFHDDMVVTAVGFAVAGGGLQLLNQSVSGGGTQIEFDVTTDQSVVPGVVRLLLTNPDGQYDETVIRIVESGDTPSPSTLTIAASALTIGDAQTGVKLFVRVTDQFGDPVPGLALACSSSDDTKADVSAASIETDENGLANVEIDAVAQGSTTVTIENVAASISGTCDVTVGATAQDLADEIEVSVGGVELTGTGTEQFTVTVKDGGASAIASHSVAVAATEASIADPVPTSGSTNGSGQLAVTARAHAPGFAPLIVTSDGMMVVVGVTVDAPLPAMQVTSVEPAQLYQSTTQLLEIRGQGFYPGTDIAFGAGVTPDWSTLRVLPDGTRMQIEVAVGASLQNVDVDCTSPLGDSSPLARAMAITASDVIGPGDVGHPTLDDDVESTDDNSVRILVDPNDQHNVIVNSDLLFGGQQSVAAGAQTFDLTNPDGSSPALRLQVAGRLRTQVAAAIGFIDDNDRLASVILGTLTHSPVGSPPLGGFVMIPADDTFVTVDLPVGGVAFSQSGFDWENVKGVRFTLTPQPGAAGAQSVVYFDRLQIARYKDFDLDGNLDVDDVELFSNFADQSELAPYIDTPDPIPVLQLPTPIDRGSVPVLVAPTDDPLRLAYHGDDGADSADVILTPGTSANIAAAELVADAGVTDWAKSQRVGTWAISTTYAAGDIVADSQGDLFRTAVGGTSAGDDSDLAGGSDTAVTWQAVADREAFADGIVYAAHDVVQTIDGVWYYTATGGTSDVVGVQHGQAHYAAAPLAGCRSAFVEPVVLAQSGCRSVLVTPTAAEFFSSGCQCAPDTPTEQTISGQVSDALFHRLLADDGFRGTPQTYGETFWLEYCVSGTWTRIGSLSTPNQVLHAGGGRSDPSVPGGIPTNPSTSDPIYVTVYHGPNANNAAARESLIAANLNITPSTGVKTVTVTVSPAGVVGFAVGMPVWLRNNCNAAGRAYSIADIEASTDPEVTGLYGVITAIDSLNNQIDVQFPSVPTPANQAVTNDFLMTQSASLLVSPSGAMGHYWEASEGLAELISGGGVNVRWWFRYWNAAGSWATITDRYDGAPVLIADGDGVTRNFELVDGAKVVIPPHEFRKLGLEQPLTPVSLDADADEGDTDIEVCDPAHWSPGDLITIADDDNPQGWTTSVESVDTGAGTVTLAESVPLDLPGVVGFTGFTTASNAVAYKPVAVAHKAISPTTYGNPDGTPLFGTGFGVVDHEAGRVTFERGFSGRVRAFYVTSLREHGLPAVAGHYMLQSINDAGIAGGLSTPIRVVT